MTKSKKSSVEVTDKGKPARVVKAQMSMMRSGVRVEINGVNARVKSMSPIALSPLIDNDYEQLTLLPESVSYLKRLDGSNG